MKKKIFSFMLISLFAISCSAYAAPGDEIPDKENGMWQLAASGLLGQVMTAMNQMPSGFYGSSSRNLWVFWMQIHFARSSVLGIVYPDDVYYGILDRVQGYNYGRPRYLKMAYPPQSAQLSGDDIVCSNARDNDRTPLLYEWDDTDFIESTIAGTLDAGVWTFAAPPAGEYVVAYNDGFSLCSEYITVP